MAKTCDWLGALVGALAGVSLAAGGVSAQISAPAATKNPANSADAFEDGLLTGAQITSVAAVQPGATGTTFTTRYSFVVGTDTGIFTSATRTLTANYRVNFNLTVPPGQYLLNVATSRQGALTLVDDGSASATATTGAVAGSYSGAGALGGSLAIPGPTNLSGNSGGNTPFSGSTAGVTISGTSTGALTAHELNFNWTSSCSSNSGFTGGDECAVRGGLPITYSGQSAGNYPGVGGRVQANDGHFVTVILAAYCGDGVHHPGMGEDCDEGSANGSATSCCGADCIFKPISTVCRAASPGEVCDEVEVCTGLSGSCPADAVQPNGTPCRAAAGVCDLAESCDGASKFCPADAKSSAVCRASGGVCDVVESCDGVNDDCPSDGFEPNTTVCRPAADLCDAVENCTGSSATCPGDALLPNGTLCNAGSGDLCDPDETCDGSNIACPADTVAPGGTLCRAGSGDVCDPDEFCTGVADETCPADVVEPGSTVCNAGSGDLCDPDEFCPGVPTGTCAADVVAPLGTVCRAGSGDLCDPDETCSGNADEACPADVVEPGTTVCNPGSGDVCDPDEFCPGVAAGTCAADVFEPSTTVCRGAAAECDVAENCPGTADGACPGDAKEPSSTVCRAAAGVCDVGESCDGVTDTCPVDAFEPSSTQCRAAAGVCDVAETCTGSSADCPADGFEPDSTPCADGTFCNGDETCQSGTCSAGVNPCALGENCDEGSQLCFLGNCPSGPTASCVTAQKAKLIIKDKADDTKDRLVWKWTKGDATTLADFENPTTTADYVLCFYEGAGSSLIGEASVPAGAGWSTISTKGYKYKDTAGANDGVTKVLVKSGAAGKSKALVKGKGTNLPDFTLPLDVTGDGVVVQLRNNGNGQCLTSAFTNPKKNQNAPTGLFKAKVP